jgi:hypothetical protein
MQDEAREDRTLRRIIALLVALAGLAERVAGRCYPVRFIVLLLLRRAETVARDYVAEAMLLDGLWFDDGMACTSSAEDAALLAERFRLLAAELCALLPPAGLAGRARDRAGASGRVAPVAGRRPVRPGGWQPAVNDTS